MAISKVGTIATAGASASVAALSATVGAAGVPAGHHVTVQAVIQNSHTVSSVVDSKGNTYVAHKVRASTGGNPTVMLASAYITTPLVSGDTITVNWDTAGFCAMLVTEWAGGDPAGWFDTASVGADGAGTSAMTVGSLTTSVPDTLVIAAFGLTGTWNISAPGAGYAVGGSTAASTGTVRTADYEYRLDARAAGTETPTATASGNNNWVGIAVAFKPATGGGTNATAVAVPMAATGGMAAPLASAGASVSAAPMSATGGISLASGAFSSEVAATAMAAAGGIVTPTIAGGSAVPPHPATPTVVVLDPHQSTITLDAHQSSLTLDPVGGTVVLDPHAGTLTLDDHRGSLALDA